MTTVRNSVRSIARSHARLKVCRAAGGFTLLELLIAAALSSVLLALVWQTLATHSRLYEKRGEATGRSQLARAVRYQFLNDIDQLIRTPFTDSRQTAARDTAPNPLPYGLRGDRHSLEIAILVPAWRPSPSEMAVEGVREDAVQSEEAPPTSPIRLVRYRFVGASGRDNMLPGSLSQVVADAIQQESDTGQTPTLTDEGHLLDAESAERDVSETNPYSPGLLREVHPQQAVNRGPRAEQHDTTARLSDDSLLQPAAPASTDLTETPRPPTVSSADVTVDHVPEIAHLEFRYFDGHRWHVRWDSSISGNLPTAVEMSFELAPSEPPLRPRRPIPQPDLGPGKLARPAHQQTAALGSSTTLDLPDDETSTVFRSLAILRAAPRQTPSSAGMEVDP